MAKHDDGGSSLNDVTVPPESLVFFTEDENLDGPVSQDAQDHKSVSVTTMLNVEKLDVDLYRGRHHWVHRSEVWFGGEIVGQALVAAATSVNESFNIHSLQCYFVRAGDTEIPVLYQVERTRDGRSFSLRSVTATQYGRPILICQVSFHNPKESPLQHQSTMPEVPQPEELLTADELFTLHISKPDLAENEKLAHNGTLLKAFPFEVKPVDQSFFTKPAAREPRMLLWLRSRGHLGEGRMNLHRCAAAYVSDFLIMDTALLPYPDYKSQFRASLNHAMWFHSTFRSDEWMLYECESPWAGSSRGLVHGRLWRRDGVLAASCSQEAVLRVTPASEMSKL